MTATTIWSKLLSTFYFLVCYSLGRDSARATFYFLACYSLGRDSARATISGIAVSDGRRRATTLAQP